MEDPYEGPDSGKDQTSAVSHVSHFFEVGDGQIKVKKHCSLEKQL